MKEISKMLLELLGTYHVYVFEYDQFYGFHSVNGTADERARVQIGDKFGLISGSGSTTVPVEYEDVGLTGDELIPVKQGGEYYYMDSNGYRQIVTKKPATAIGTFGSELAPVQVDGKYGYIDTDMKEGHFDYEFAGSFENGVAAVKKGGKWGLIDTTFAERVPCQFDEILVDGYGFGTTYGVFFAKSGGSYALYDLSGNQLAGGFSEARMFASKEPAAVKKDGKWCFVSREGEIVLTPDQNYEDANSFSAGYAAVKKGGKWGCIETQGRMVIQPEFDVLLPFSRNGYAYAEQEDQQLFVAVSLLE